MKYTCTSGQRTEFINVETGVHGVTTKPGLTNIQSAGHMHPSRKLSATVGHLYSFNNTV